MRRSFIFYLLGPLFVFYFASVLFSSNRPFTWNGLFFVISACLISFVPFVFRFKLPRQFTSQVIFLSLGAGFMWLGWADSGVSTDLVEVLKIAGPVLFGLSIFEMAFHFLFPSSPTFFIKLGWLLSWFSALVVTILGVLAILPVFEWRGYLQVFPVHLRWAPWGFLFCMLALSLALRGYFQWHQKDPEKKASNLWAWLPLVATCVVLVFYVVLFYLDVLDLEGDENRIVFFVLTLSLIVGHLRSLDSQKRLEVSALFREVVSVVFASWIVTGLLYLFQPAFFSDSAWSVFLIMGAFLLSFGLKKQIQRGLNPILSPFGGKLLEAVYQADHLGANAGTFDDFVKEVLKPFRATSDNPKFGPRLFVLNPDKELSLDAAGNVRVISNVIPKAISEHLEKYPKKIVVYSFVEHLRVRRPDLRALIECLESLDVLCVIPFYSEENLEGILLLPKGTRKSSPTLEELTALYRLSNVIAGFVSIQNSYARLEAHLNEQTRKNTVLLDQLDQLQEEKPDAGHEFTKFMKTSFLRFGMTVQEPFQSEPMQSVKKRLMTLARTDVPVLLCGELGTDFSFLTNLIHQNSPYADFSCMHWDCNKKTKNLNTNVDEPTHGDRNFFELKNFLEHFNGTLVLRHVAGFSLEEQRELAEVFFKSKQANPTNVLHPLCPFRVILTSDIPYAALQKDSSSFFQSLRPSSLNVLPLSERKDDLLALANSYLQCFCEQLGVVIKKLDSSAEEKILQHDWAGNHVELCLSMMMTVKCNQDRITITGANVAILRDENLEKEGRAQKTYFEFEKEILMDVLQRASGNKSQAARLLGLKRTTFVDKLKKIQLREEEGLED